VFRENIENSAPGGRYLIMTLGEKYGKKRQNVKGKVVRDKIKGKMRSI
jgi:hypothetical protein